MEGSRSAQEAIQQEDFSLLNQRLMRDNGTTWGSPRMAVCHGEDSTVRQKAGLLGSQTDAGELSHLRQCGRLESAIMKVFQVNLAALALVSLVLTPPLAANTGLLNGPDAGTRGGQFPVVLMAEGLDATKDAGSRPQEATGGTDTGSQATPSAGFSPEELAALEGMALSDEEAAKHEGAGVLVVSLGGLLVVALLVILILILTDTIQLNKPIFKSDSDDKS
jgi:hypothetical protein